MIMKKNDITSNTSTFTFSDTGKPDSVTKYDLWSDHNRYWIGGGKYLMPVCKYLESGGIKVVWVQQ